MVPSLQWKGPVRVSLPLQVPSCKPSLLSKLTLALAIRSYSTTAFSIAFIFWRRDTKTVISSANAKNFALNGHSAGPELPLFPKPTKQGLQSGDIEKRRQRAALLDRSLDRERPRTPSVHLHHCLRVVIHHANPFAEFQFESGSLQNRHQKPMVNPIEGFGLI